MDNKISEGFQDMESEIYLQVSNEVENVIGNQQSFDQVIQDLKQNNKALNENLKELNDLVLLIQRILGYDFGEEITSLQDSIGSYSTVKDPLFDSWILYQFNPDTNACDIRELFNTKNEAVKVYQSKNLHIQYNQEGTRERGDVGLMVHQKTVFFESNIHRWTNWGGEAEINL